jgi:hypothetical protein
MNYGKPAKKLRGAAAAEYASSERININNPTSHERGGEPIRAGGKRPRLVGENDEHVNLDWQRKNAAKNYVANLFV